MMKSGEQVRPVRRGLQVLGVAMTELVGKGKQKIGEAWGRLTKGTKKDTEDVNDLTVVD